MEKCRICDDGVKKIFSAKVLDKYNVEYFFCDKCGFIQCVQPFWLEEAYRQPINLTDTGILQRNIQLAKITKIVFLTYFKENLYLDYAGGYGILVRLLRDYGLNFKWIDSFASNIFARGFEYNKEKVSAITCFECFEHFVDPLKDFEKILSISPNVLLSTTLFDGVTPPTLEWPYYGFEHGQHVCFFSFKTLKYLSNKYNLRVYSNGKNLHLFTKKKINEKIYKMLILLGKFLYFFQFDYLFQKLARRNGSENDRISLK